MIFQTLHISRLLKCAPTTKIVELETVLKLNSPLITVEKKISVKVGIIGNWKAEVPTIGQLIIVKSTALDCRAASVSVEKLKN